MSLDCDGVAIIGRVLTLSLMAGPRWISHGHIGVGGVVGLGKAG